MAALKTWGEALAGMPRLTDGEWQNLDPVAKWLVACRAGVLFMTFTAAGLGGLMAWRAGQFDATLWLCATLGLVFAHATNNMLNDYTDSRRGIDKNNYYRNQYGVHVLEQGLMSQQQFWRYLAFTGAIALLAGAYLVAERGGQTLNLMLAGSFFVLFYTWPLKYCGLGEPSVLLVWGPLMVGGTFYVVTGFWDWDVTWLSLLFALGPTSVLFGKHTDKLPEDKAKGVRTLPVLIGEGAARASVIGMIIGMYGLSVWLVLNGSFHWALLLVLLNLPDAWKATQLFLKPKPAQAPQDYPPGIWPLWFSARAFAHTRRFTSLFLLGVLADCLLAV